MNLVTREKAQMGCSLLVPYFEIILKEKAQKGLQPFKAQILK